MRLSASAWGIGMAELTAKRSTCLRRQVGCVLVDANNFVLSTGYNGVARGMPHCNEKTYTDEMTVGESIPFFHNACPAAFALSGTNLDGCHAIHAEQNALLQCRDVQKIHTCYTTASPCLTCVKLLMNTSCVDIVYLEEYPHPAARDLWQNHDAPFARGWYQFER